MGKGQVAADTQREGMGSGIQVWVGAMGDKRPNMGQAGGREGGGLKWSAMVGRCWGRREGRRKSYTCYTDECWPGLSLGIPYRAYTISLGQHDATTALCRTLDVE